MKTISVLGFCFLRPVGMAVSSLSFHMEDVGRKNGLLNIFPSKSLQNDFIYRNFSYCYPIHWSGFLAMELVVATLLSLIC